MQYVVKKTYLGLALQQIIEEFGLEHMQKQLNQQFKQAFIKNYNELVYNAPQVKSIFGFGGQISCCTVITNRTKYEGELAFLENHVSSPTCVEVYSDNKKIKRKRIHKNLRLIPKKISKQSQKIANFVDSAKMMLESKLMK